MPRELRTIQRLQCLRTSSFGLRTGLEAVRLCPRLEKAMIKDCVRSETHHQARKDTLWSVRMKVPRSRVGSIWLTTFCDWGSQSEVEWVKETRPLEKSKSRMVWERWWSRDTSSRATMVMSLHSCTSLLNCGNLSQNGGGVGVVVVWDDVPNPFELTDTWSTVLYCIHF